MAREFSLVRGFTFRSRLLQRQKMQVKSVLRMLARGFSRRWGAVLLDYYRKCSLTN